MLIQFFDSQLVLGGAQAATATIFALLMLLVARLRHIHVQQQAIIALARGIIQIVAVGSVLVLLLQGPDWTSIIVLGSMIVIAASISARRARKIPGAFWVSLYGIGLGAGLTILLMTWLGVIDAAISSLIPLGSMIIANAMNTNALALERFRAEVESHAGQVEAGLALGADPRQTVRPYVQAAVEASLIPKIDSLRSLGIVWIPGIMTGMVLSGSDPIYAAIYQFVVMGMIFASSGLTAVTSTLLIRTHAFSPAEQLILRAPE